MNIKITAITLLAIFVAIIIFYFVMNWYPSNFDSTYTWVEHIKNKSNKSKILIFGSSHTGSLDANYIQEYLIKNGADYEVYNLSIASDYPTRRAESIGYISELEPKMILYGIDIRMFEGQSSGKEEHLTALQISKINDVLPNTKEFFELVVFPLTDNEFFTKIPKSPKIVTLQTIKHFVRNSDNITELDIDSNRPFFNIENNVNPIVDIEEMEKEVENKQFYGINLERNREFDTLKEIARELENKDIKLVIFATPNSRTFLNWLPTEGEIVFEQLFKEIEKTGVTVYPKHDRYADHNIWTNIDHVVENESGIIYSQDVAKMILKEIQK